MKFDIFISISVLKKSVNGGLEVFFILGNNIDFFLALNKEIQDFYLDFGIENSVDGNLGVY